MGSLDLEHGAFVVGHGRAPAVSSLVVVLRIKHAIGILGIDAAIAIAIVRAARIVEIDVANDKARERNDDANSEKERTGHDW